MRWVVRFESASCLVTFKADVDFFFPFVWQIRYQDFLDQDGITTSKAYVLQGGVRAWLAKYGSDKQLVDKD